LTGELAPPAAIADPGVVCVLGMHRSGTSLIARLANILGLALGPDAELAPAAYDNPRGFWEHMSFRRVNEALLARLGRDWDSLEELPDGWQDDPAHDDLRDQARAAIAAFAGADLWGWKDPRTCLTLPFWRPLLPPLRFVLCVRSVIDVARSLQRRNSIPIEQGVRLWLHYTTAALAQTAGQPTLCMFYEDVLTDPHGQAARLSEYLTGDAARAATKADAIVDAVDAALHHHHSTTEDVARDETVHEAARSLYVILRASVPEPPVDGQPRFFETVATLAREAAQAPESAVVIRDLRAAYEQQSQELDARAQELNARIQELEALAAEIQALKAQVREHQDSLDVLRAEALALSGAYRDAVASTQTLSAELHAILTSRAWRWITEYRRLRGWIHRRRPPPHRSVRFRA
jgi:hypothetical protein